MNEPTDFEQDLHDLDDDALATVTGGHADPGGCFPVPTLGDDKKKKLLSGGGDPTF